MKFGHFVIRIIINLIIKIIQIYLLNVVNYLKTKFMKTRKFNNSKLSMIKKLIIILAKIKKMKK